MLGSQHSRERAFEFEQPSFHVKAAAVTTERAVGGNHAMAGDDDRDWVAIVGHADGAECIRFAYGPGNVGVSARLSIGNRQQRAPAGKLEIGAAKIERESKLAALAGEIFF